jgi:putative ABC transport system permease protein
VRVEVVAGPKLEAARSLAVMVSRVPGVVATSTVKRSIVYLGSQRDDVFGIDPGAATSAGVITDRDLVGESSQAALRSLRGTPDGVLVPQRTVQSYSLRTGDLLRLRLLSPASRATFYQVPFHVVGTVRSFAGSPSAGTPFLLVNTRYLESVTRSGDYIVLVSVKGDAAGVRARIAKAIAPAHVLLLPAHPRALDAPSSHTHTLVTP